MSYRKIHILGGPGSGKSYIAGRISAATGIPVFDLDNIFWDRKAGRYGIRASEEDRNRSLARVLSRDCWIIEGVYHQWLAQSFKDADLIVVLTPPVWLRDWRVMRRFIRRGLGFEDSKGETFADFRRLIAWNHAYDGDNLRRARKFIIQHGHKTFDCKDIDNVMRILRR